jgi:hypothetical protein
MPGPESEWEEGIEEDSGPINDEHDGGGFALAVEGMEEA